MSRFDDEPQRWDRDRFERMSRRAPEEREQFRYDERERVGPRGGFRDVALEERIDRRSPRGARFEERERFFEEERFGPPARRRPDFMEETIPAEVANRALAPYRRRSIVERDVDVPVRRPRPQFIRRQSSLDTFDRKPLPRYGDEYRIPAGVPVPLPIRRPHSPPGRYRESFEDVRYRDQPPAEVNEYRDIRIRRERGGGHRSRSHAATSVRSASSSSSSFEEVPAPAPTAVGKRGKTRMPKRLAHKKAIIELGYPFEEEDDFIIVQRALQKEHIDEIIEKSKGYKEEKTIYKYTAETEKIEEKIEEKKTGGHAHHPSPPVTEVPLPPASHHHSEHHHEDHDHHSDHEHHGQPGETVVKTTTTIENIPRSPSPAHSVASHKTHKSHHHHGHEHKEIVEEFKLQESNHIGGPLTIVEPRGHHHSDHIVGIGGPLTIVEPRGRHQSDHDIRREIKALEAERRALKLEREADERRYQAALIRDSDYEIIESDRIVERPRARSRSVVRVEKDRKGRLALVRSAN